MKTIAIIGASAGVGLEAVKYALSKGIRVRTLSRRLPDVSASPNLYVVKGSATSAADVEKAIEGADAILVTLGTGMKITWSDFTRGTTLYRDATRALLEVLQRRKSTLPLIVLTGFGAGESRKFQPLPMRLFMDLLLGRLYTNKTEMEGMITGGYKNWEIIRPGMLTDGAAKEVQFTTALTKGMRVGRIPRSSVARVMVDQAIEPTAPGQYLTPNV